MSNSLTLNPSLQERNFLKSGKKFSDFCFVVLFLFSCIAYRQQSTLKKNFDKAFFNDLTFPKILFKKNSIALMDSVPEIFFIDTIPLTRYTKPIKGLFFIYQTLIDNPTITIGLDAHCSSDEKI